jgi:hypothetical protein
MQKLVIILLIIMLLVLFLNNKNEHKTKPKPNPPPRKPDGKPCKHRFNCVSHYCSGENTAFWERGICGKNQLSQGAFCNNSMDCKSNFCFGRKCW